MRRAAALAAAALGLLASAREAAAAELPLARRGGPYRGAAPTAPPPAQLRVDCAAPARPISPLIYGVGVEPRAAGPAEAARAWAVGASARRWGGNTSSRYNGPLGSWNTGSDWYFRNVGRGGEDVAARFLAQNAAAGAFSALTVPTLGWVARDAASAGFPVARHGAQRRVDPHHPDAGDGHAPGGAPLEPGPPDATSVPAPPAFVEAWLHGLRARGLRPGMVILDNEPTLWHETHRDVHPRPVGYDELLQRTLDYGAAVRRAAPEALIAGPALWGWSDLSYSPVDLAAGVRARPDRRAHGDVPLLPWLLQQVRAHERRTGTRVLDVVDVHFYPQAPGVKVGGPGRVDPESAARRLRSTRALWDPSYVDESWIAEPVALLPRLQALIQQSAPGLRLSLGEYNFGGEGHVSGALALAEALGRFGEGGLYAAFYWTQPPEGSPAAGALRAFRDFDGAGGRFGPLALRAEAPEGTSLFASRSEDGRRLVLVALNFHPTQPQRAQLALAGCGGVAPASARAFVLRAGEARLVPAKDTSLASLVLPPSSITVLDFTLASPARP